MREGQRGATAGLVLERGASPNPSVLGLSYYFRPYWRSLHDRKEDGLG